MHSPLEIARYYVEIGIAKVKLSAIKMLILGVFAGMFIGFAGIASTTSSATIENSIHCKACQRLRFPGRNGNGTDRRKRIVYRKQSDYDRLSGKKDQIDGYAEKLVFVYIGNFIGASFVAVLVVYGHTPGLYDGKLAEKMVAAAQTRVVQTFPEAFIRGILCNILVCIAVWAAFAAKKVSGKLLMSFWPVMLFVLCGFEHSIADMYFGVAGLLTAQEYGIAAKGLTWGSFLLKNLLPVTLGNLVGGAGIVSCGYWAMYLKHTPGYVLDKKQEQEEIEKAEEY